MKMAMVALPGIMLILVLAVSGCTQTQITCDPPYMVKGSNCCLDQNSNRICDSDEAGSPGGPDLIKNYGPYEVKMYISQESPEPDSWHKLPPTPRRHVDAHQIYNNPQNLTHYDGGWFILYTSYTEETITCLVKEYYDLNFRGQQSVRLTKRGLDGSVSGVSSRALFPKDGTPRDMRYELDCTGDESAIKFQDAYGVRLKPP